MLQLKNLTLFQFKNYNEKTLQFHAPIVCLHGPNGSGKTNVLDAIHFLCFTKSYFSTSDALCVQHQKEGLRVQGLFEENKSPIEVSIILREQGKKEVRANQILYTKLSQHLGKLPCVFISPDDTRLITDGSDERRRMLDKMIAQHSIQYVDTLMRYNRILQQRNALLKNWTPELNNMDALLEIYNEQLSELGQSIWKERNDYCNRFIPEVKKVYTVLSNLKEEPTILYESQLKENNFRALLKDNKMKDIVSKRSNYGIHKDDMAFTLHQLPMKQTASQGQRKSFLFGLKIAEFELLKQANATAPILLLDDIFEKLDEQRSTLLIHYLLNQNAQLFITDTHESRLRDAFANTQKEVQFISMM